MIHTSLDTRPRIGLAHWEANWESDLTGDFPGRQFCEIVRHNYTHGHCSRCGKPEQRHVVTDRLLVGCNVGHIRTTWIVNRSCLHGDCLSSYRVPW
jgi:hypothetical protein